MTQAQLLALDTILPTVLGCAGIVFLAAAVWPLRAASRGVVTRSAVLGVIGAACVGVGVWLWLSVFGAAGQVMPPGGAAPSSPTAVPASPTAAASKPSPSASAAATSSPSASAAPVPSGSAASTPAGSAAASGAPTPIPPTPTIPTNLTPVAPVAFTPGDAQPHAVIVGVEPFEHGSMLYRDDLKQIYVMTTSDQKFKVYPDTWKEGTDSDLGYAPQGASKITPGRGFGWLWASDPDVRQALGAAIATEQGFTGSISSDGTTVTIKADVTYAFNKDGTWAIK